MTNFSSRCMTPPDWAHIKNFGPHEFASPEKMGYEMLLWLDQLREAVGMPMVITSSYRDPSYNKMVGGASDSAHCDQPCNAVDVGMKPRASDPNWNATRFAVISTALKMGCRRLGSYSNGSIHLDRSEDTRPADRMWVVVAGKPKP